ncbi:MAG: hypothetical protein R3F43_19855 [bacterium]
MISLAAAGWTARTWPPSCEKFAERYQGTPRRASPAQRLRRGLGRR